MKTVRKGNVVDPEDTLKIFLDHELEKSYSDININRELILEAMGEYGKKLLTDYTDFLLKYGYCDDDVWCEGNSAIDRYMHPNLRDK